ncbi:nitroreductase family deazaflavin-dependent oxidoreductase [Microbacterium deminutum]|uniref:Nitroreductase family deazaflavin-dependent oxidoreductase n=1 Tax=Microbacterium deminutum TaxID=344164 RepID=A0ABP5C6P0_9MICO
MSFTARNGTYGARQPRATPMARWFTTRMVNRLSRRGGKFMGMDALVLETLGKKSGEQRQTPVAWFPASGGGWIIVASAAGGPRNPSWYYNIAAHPDAVHVKLAGRTTAVEPVELHGDDRAEAWARIVSIAPRFAKYETVTDREVPVIRLTPKPDAA